MAGLLPQWPLSAWATVVPLAGTAIAWTAKTLWNLFVRRSDRSASREDRALESVELLRRALDKGRVRENGVVSACDMMTIALDLAMEQLQKLTAPPSPAIERTRKRALEHLKSARECCREIEDAAL